MYYNIKIKSNDSEFSLNSENKSIIEREVDMYFAQILDVSEEFRANLKKIEITNENVHSIHELDNPELCKNIKEEPTIVDIAPIAQENPPEEFSQQEETPKEGISKIEEKYGELVLTPVNEDYISGPPENHTPQEIETKTNEIVYDSANENNEEIKDANTDNDNQLTNSCETQDVIDSDNNASNSSEVQNENTETKEEEKQEENKPYQPDAIDQDMERIKREFEMQSNQNLDDIFFGNPNVEDIGRREIFAEKIEPQPPQIIPNKMKPEKFNFEVDIKTYLSKINSENISDKFIACALYIKKALKEEYFTMKSINAKLFQTTGAIANLSVVEELIEKKYIETFMIDDSHKYCITSFGEEYCTSIYQE